MPRLVLVRPPRVILAELKSETGKLTPEQRVWIVTLAACGGNVSKNGVACVQPDPTGPLGCQTWCTWW